MNSKTQNTSSVSKDIEASIKEASDQYNYKPEKSIIIVSASKQTLYLLKDKKILKSYKISTAKAGLGCLNNSFQTPTGMHQITEKIGVGAQIGAIFKGRVETGEIADILLQPDEKSPNDNITTRILWLSGLEEGINKGGEVDSYSRYIYIHGTDEEGLIGTPASHGCIRLANTEIIDLYKQVEIGTLVYINN